VAIDWDKAVLGPVMGVFGELVHYAPAAGQPFDIADAVFDEAYREVVVEDGIPVSSVTPVLGVRLAAFLTPPAQDDALTIDRTGTTYVVREVRPDSHGEAKLMLNWVTG